MLIFDHSRHLRRPLNAVILFHRSATRLPHRHCVDVLPFRFLKTLSLDARLRHLGSLAHPNIPGLPLFAFNSFSITVTPPGLRSFAMDFMNTRYPSSPLGSPQNRRHGIHTPVSRRLLSSLLVPWPSLLWLRSDVSTSWHPSIHCLDIFPGTLFLIIVTVSST